MNLIETLFKRRSRLVAVRGFWLCLAVFGVVCCVGFAGCAALGSSEGDGLETDAGSGDVEDETGPDDLANALGDLGESGFSGVVLIDQGGEVLTESFGLADASLETPNRSETVFDFGSITKQFTATAVLRLQMDGHLTIDDQVSMYLPALTGAMGELTIHQLLTHTAGLPDSLGRDDEYIARDDYLDLVNDAAFVVPPGEEHRYSNVGYSVLAAVIEQVSGQSFEQYLADNLFEPAGMAQTGYVLPAWNADTMAVGYRAGETVGRPTEANWSIEGPSWHLMGNGGILSTVQDMHLWHTALLGDEILDEQAKGQLFTPHVAETADNSSFYGYGWAIFTTPWDTTLVTHDGGNGVFFADFLRFVDDDLTIVLASNDDATVPRDAALTLAAAITGQQLVTASCEVASIVGLEVIGAFPDTSSGATAAAFFELVRTGDSLAVEDFSANYISEELAAGRSVPELAALLVGLQAEFEPYVDGELAQEDEWTFHQSMTSPTASAVVSVATDPTRPDTLRCVSVSITPNESE